MLCIDIQPITVVYMTSLETHKGRETRKIYLFHKVSILLIRYYENIPSLNRFLPHVDVFTSFKPNAMTISGCTPGID